MKNPIPFIILILFIVHHCYAQENKIGYRLGIGGSTPSKEIGPWQDPLFLNLTGNSNSFNQEGGLGFRGGLVINVYINDVLSFQPELLYTSSSITNTRANQNVIVQIGEQIMLEEEEVTYALRYIELPLLLKYNFYKRWSILGGISPAFNIYSKIHMNYWEPNNDSGIDDIYWRGGTYTTAEEDIEKFDFDYANKILANANIELNYRVGRRGFLFLNYSGSINDIFKIDELDGYNMKCKFQTFTFGFGGIF